MIIRRGPMMRPVVRPMGSPLLRGMLVGGTAYAAGRGAARRQQNEADQNEALQQQQRQIQDLQAQQTVPPAAAPAAPAPNLADQLTQLGQLVQQGLMTPEEFAAAKAKLLGGGA
ncbi:SHOCT domain-containing protein [Streptomyces sp. NPDC050095]|uniref:SHOCT domain-containing protein n=1 Tax=unclassified Streptomyces TaxID=2593676 RepID=UPI003419CF32